MTDLTTRHSSDVKICNKCKQEKPLDEFSRGRGNADGLQRRCKACDNESRRAWSIANREREAERQRAHRAANRERLAEYYRNYRSANAERIAERIRAWREANPEKVVEYYRAWREANPEKVAEHAARTRAKYPDRIAARKAVNHAVERDDFPPASALVCEHCQEAQAQEYHHYLGYAPEHALDVIAVCIACHKELHIK